MKCSTSLVKPALPLNETGRSGGFTVLFKASKYLISIWCWITCEGCQGMILFSSNCGLFLCSCGRTR